jgi:hypothetical protein
MHGSMRRGLETERPDQGHRGGTADRETGGRKAPGPTVRPRHRASPRPYLTLGWWAEVVAGSCFPGAVQAWLPGCRAGRVGFHGPLACPFLLEVWCVLVSRVRGLSI